MRTYQVISADSHLEGPVDWTKWLPRKYWDMAPKLVTHDDGSQAWRIEIGSHAAERVIGAGLYCGARYDEATPKLMRTYYKPDGSPRPGTGDSKQRLREQDQDGLDAEVLYFHACAGMVNEAKGRDNEAYLALTRMYNDWVIDYCSIAPDRLIGNCHLPTTSVADAIAEMERCKKAGLRTTALQQWPNGTGDPSKDHREDDRFWAAALDMDMKLSPHVTFGAGIASPSPIPGGVSPDGAISGLGFSGGRPSVTIGQLTYHGVFDRFPKMQIYFGEAGAGWLAMHLDWMDEFYNRWYTFLDIKLKKQPSQYIRDHVKFSFIHDRMAMKLKDYIGVDLLMWGSDFPHSVGTFPDSKMVLDEIFEGISPAERRQVLVGNVCDFFGLDAEKPLTATP